MTPPRTLPSDTTPEAEAVQIEIYRRMSAQRKLELVEEENCIARELALAGLRQRHPTAGPEELFRRLMELSSARSWQPGCTARWNRRDGMDEPPAGPAVPLVEVLDALERLGVRHHLGGSSASSIHGLPRQTRDADLVVDLRAATRCLPTPSGSAPNRTSSTPGERRQRTTTAP